MGINNIPEENITVEETNFTLTNTKINSSFKAIDTLYLREQSYDALVSVLKLFMNDKIYEELGIRNKMGVMLYGKPGTGKSSTILAIASFLKRDIYYVSLNGIKTNAHLSEIFDHINKNVAKKGLIVFEDIDAMTSMVHKRVSNSNSDQSTEVSVTELMNNSYEVQSLDLSYFLNLLDGTLSSESCAFVMSTNHIEKLDPAIYRAGRMDICIELMACDHYQIKKIFKRIINRDIDPAVLSQIPDNRFVPAEIIFHLIRYIYDKKSTDAQIMYNFLSGSTANDYASH
jgi:ATP-dependent 26S proteasome regulatory subunit